MMSHFTSFLRQRADKEVSFPSIQLTAIVLFLCTLALFSRSLLCGFMNFDDQEYVFENQHVHGGFTVDNVRWAMTTSHMGSWHPLTWFSLMLDTHLWGKQPAGYHATGVVIHGINATLTFLLLHRLTGSHWRSVVAASFWAFHPLRIESVTWISERKDVLCVMFGLAALVAYERYARSTHRRRRIGWYISTWVLMLMSLASKPMTVTLPCVMLLLDVWPLERLQFDKGTRWGRASVLIIEKWPGWVMVAIFSILTFHTQRHVGTVQSVALVSPMSRLAIMLNSYLTYTQMTFAPYDLALFYPLVVPSELRLSISATLLAVVSASVFLLMRRFKTGVAAAIGWLWYLGVMLPVSGVIQAGSQAVADRYTYFPTIGLCIAIVWILGGLIDHALSRHHGCMDCRVAVRGSAGVASLAIVGILSVMTWRQIGLWQEPLVMWSHNLRVTPYNPNARSLLGACLISYGRWVEAEYHLSIAVNQDPSDYKSFVNLSSLALVTRRPQLAERYTAAALALDDSDPAMNLRMANLLIPRGPASYERAIAHLRKAITALPDDAHARSTLAALLDSVGRPVEAEVHWRETLRINPNHPDANIHFGDLLLNQGKPQQAISHFQASLASSPNHPVARKKLALAFIGVRQYVQAIEQISAALRTDERDPVMWLCLGMAHLESNRPDMALDALRRATELAPNNAMAFRYRARAALMMKLADEAMQSEQAAAKLEAESRRPPG